MSLCPRMIVEDTSLRPSVKCWTASGLFPLATSRARKRDSENRTVFCSTKSSILTILFERRLLSTIDGRSRSPVCRWARSVRDQNPAAILSSSRFRTTRSWIACVTLRCASALDNRFSRAVRQPSNSISKALIFLGMMACPPAVEKQRLTKCRIVNSFVPVKIMCPFDMGCPSPLQWRITNPVRGDRAWQIRWSYIPIRSAATRTRSRRN